MFKCRYANSTINLFLTKVYYQDKVRTPDKQYYAFWPHLKYKWIITRWEGGFSQMKRCSVLHKENETELETDAGFCYPF